MAGKTRFGNHRPRGPHAGRERRAIHRQRRRAVALLAALAAAAGLAQVPAFAQTAGPSAALPSAAPLRVRAGEELVLRAPAGVIHAEAVDPSVAAVTMPTPDTIVVVGIRPADTQLLLVNGATVLAQTLRVAPPLELSAAQIGNPAPVGFADLTYIPDTQTFWVDVHRPGFDATVSPGAWQMNLIGGGVTVLSASALATPLQNFGIAPSWGASARTPGGWELVASGTQSEFIYHRSLGGPNEAALGATVAGPLGTLHLEGGTGFSTDVAVLYGQNGLESAGTVGKTIGTVPVAISFGPQGGAVSAQLTEKGWTLSAADGVQGIQIGVDATVGSGNHLTVWWNAQGSYGLGLTLPLGPDGTVTVSANSGSIFVGTNSAGSPADAGTATSGFGAGQLTVTSPQAGFPSLRQPVSLQPSPPPIQPFGPPNPLIPYYVNARVEIPASYVAAPRSSTDAVGAGPVTIPTGSAALITHICLHSASPKTTCDPSDPMIAVRLYVDDRPVELTGVALPIAPGPHIVSIHPQDLPPFVVPLGALSCPITAVAGGVTVCDFAFRRAGTP